ncbi:uncharacterized protein LOC128991304 [Macrosteles quadrilineatus]|uniref:uncharacterized protein LOC128991304 n=1 Tax=Macrosteles quadrilineatus TaxID=74068 RepID=UPI0023E307CF|nr:uncharacterized protein LOC128991304 [Macrosteles quadrilineatus]
MTQPITPSDLSFFEKESRRRRQVYEARRSYGGPRSKWLPGPVMQERIINGVKLSVWMFIAIAVMSYFIIKNTKGELEDPSNSFQDHTRQIIFKPITQEDYIPAPEAQKQKAKVKRRKS